jgi:hypothetical protein
MKLITLIFLLFFLGGSTFAQTKKDTIIPSKHKFESKEVYVPKLMQASMLIQMYMEFLKEGKRTIGFLHEDELAMIDEKKLTEKKLFFDSYKVVTTGRRMAVVQVYSARGTSINCKKLTLRYYQNMKGYYYLIPGKVETFEKKMGDITLKEVFINTWTMQSMCN